VALSGRSTAVHRFVDGFVNRLFAGFGSITPL
jgi:hypothetical protein